MSRKHPFFILTLIYIAVVVFTLYFPTVYSGPEIGDPIAITATPTDVLIDPPMFPNTPTPTP